MLTFQKGNVINSRLQVRIIFFLVTALPTCILSLVSSGKKKCKERVLNFSWPKKCTLALTAKMMFIHSLNTWQNKNKQNTEYDFPFNISHCYMRNSFVLSHKLCGWFENSPLNLMVYQEVVLMLFTSLKKVIKYNISRDYQSLLKSPWNGYKPFKSSSAQCQAPILQKKY